MKSSKGNISRTRPAPMRQKLCSALLLAMVACTAPAWAQRNDAPQAYSISAGDLAGALDQLASQSKVQILYPAELVRGKRVAVISGQQTWREVLQKLLAGSGLEWGFVNDTTVVIRKSEKVERPAAAAPTAATPVRKNLQPEIQDLEKVTATGTRIRGGSTPSPVITIGSERIQEEGFTDLGEVIRSVPQNFTGGQNPGVIPGNLAGAGLANNNLTGGSGLNLRGLGPDASLTLLNGRRMSYGGFVQAVDISAIPVEAVERIEIVADGASAIYGSDAVGGVGNVILKRDFDGFVLGTHFGDATDGGMATREYTATAGTTWSSGSVIATYKDALVDPIYARQREYSAHLVDPTTIYPGSDLRSGLFSISQSLGDVAELRLDTLRSKREQHYNYFLSNRITFVAADTATSLVSPSVQFFLPNDWSMSLAGTWGKDEHHQVQSRLTLATGVTALQLDQCYCNESRVYEIGAEGPLFALASGDARLALGAGYRKNEFQRFDYVTNTANIDGDENSRFAYAEASMPLLGSKSGMDERPLLDLMVAIRNEDYGSHGRVTTPKAGIVFRPGADFTLKASWGKSFKMPTLFQRYQAPAVNLTRPSTYGGSGYPADAQMLTLGGGNTDLEPEHARTWSASLAFHPEALPGLEAEVTCFDIDYTDRVIEPITNYAAALIDPNYTGFIVHDPSPAEQAAVMAAAQSINNLIGVPYDANNVVALMYARYVNVSQQRIRGVDFTGAYRFYVGTGRLTMRGSASLLDSSQQTSAAQGPYDLAGTLHNPAKLNSRAGLVWNQSGFTASAFANYTSGVTNTLDGRKGGSFTTFDATVRYNTGTDAGPWSGLDFSLSAQNLLNREPPLYTPPPVAAIYRAPYDSTNYSPIGRYVSLSVSKQW